jgi:hypothetical protein
MSGQNECHADTEAGTRTGGNLQTRSANTAEPDTRSGGYVQVKGASQKPAAEGEKGVATTERDDSAEASGGVTESTS